MKENIVVYNNISNWYKVRIEILTAYISLKRELDLLYYISLMSHFIDLSPINFSIESYGIRASRRL